MLHNALKLSLCQKSQRLPDHEPFFAVTFMWKGLVAVLTNVITSQKDVNNSVSKR